MVDVQMKLTDLREDAYGKVLKCLPYPRQWVRCQGKRSAADIQLQTPVPHLLRLSCYRQLNS